MAPIKFMIGAVIFIRNDEFGGGNVDFIIVSSYNLSFNGEGTLFFYVEI